MVVRGIIRRQLSTSCRTAQQSLPDSKLRLVISLHHQARSFITPENLDAAIVQAFTPRSVDNMPERLSLSDIQTHMADANSSTGGAVVGGRGTKRVEEDGYSKRGAMLQAALFGTDAVGGRVGLPGLETVREEVAADKEDASRR